MSADAWDDDEQDEYRPRPKVDIGQDVHVLRPAALKSGRGRRVWVIVLAPFALAIVGGVELALNVPTDAGPFSLPPIPMFIFVGGLLAASLIALPGLLKIGREQATQELRIGDLGMEIVQTLVPGKPPMTTWSLLWKDLAGIKFNYRGVQGPNVGIVVTAKSGQTQFLRPADWVSAEGQSPVAADIGSALLSEVKSSAHKALEHSDLVRELQQRGHTVDDDIPRPQDRLAAIIGLSLGIGAIVAALIFNYIESK
ncbi:MAG TPA: hypothetical protein VFK21_12030 [Gammaproteobacteria bacterium]|nr:hypothetical protein [Gammaproteobacteria bacterium]